MIYTFDEFASKLLSPLGGGKTGGATDLKAVRAISALYLLVHSSQEAERFHACLKLRNLASEQPALMERLQAVAQDDPYMRVCLEALNQSIKSCPTAEDCPEFNALAGKVLAMRAEDSDGARTSEVQALVQAEVENWAREIEPEDHDAAAAYYASRLERALVFAWNAISQRVAKGQMGSTLAIRDALNQARALLYILGRLKEYGQFASPEEEQAFKAHYQPFLDDLRGCMDPHTEGLARAPSLRPVPFPAKNLWERRLEELHHIPATPPAVERLRDFLAVTYPEAAPFTTEAFETSLRAWRAAQLREMYPELAALDNLLQPYLLQAVQEVQRGQAIANTLRLAEWALLGVEARGILAEVGLMDAAVQHYQVQFDRLRALALEPQNKPLQGLLSPLQVEKHTRGFAHKLLFG